MLATGEVVSIYSVRKKYMGAAVVKAPPVIKKRVNNVLRSAARRKIDMGTAFALLDSMVGEMPTSCWVDCGDFYLYAVMYISEDSEFYAPVIDIRGKRFSRSGSCPKCGQISMMVITGDDRRVEVICQNCCAVYATTSRVVETYLVWKEFEEGCWLPL